MWWFAAIYLINSLIPSELLFGAFSVNIGFARVTVIDILLFTGPLFTLLPGWRDGRWNTGRLHPAYFAGFVLLLLVVVYAAVVGALHIRPETVRWYFQPFRNLAMVLFGLYMGYMCLNHPGQARRAVWIIFIGSIMSAVLSLYYANVTTNKYVAGESYGFDELRESALQVSGDAGMVAACIIIFGWVSSIRILSNLKSIVFFAIASLGMFFIPHRSAWLLYAIACLYTGFYVWPARFGRKLILSILSISAIIGFAVVAILFIQARTGHDFGGWVQKRLESLLPESQGDQRKDARAWDTRVPGIWFDLRVWGRNPFGGGFGAHEYYILTTGDRSGGSLRHTPWTSTLAETGPVGVAVFMVVIVGGWWVGLRLARESTSSAFAILGAAVSVSMLVSFIVGFMSLSWNAPRGALALGLLAGIAFRSRELQRAEDQVLSTSYDGPLDMPWGSA